CQQFNNLPRTF
nr:immunoglobulin light chain junction region [Macaca mulatta]